MALLQISSPYVQTRTGGSNSGAEWVGSDFEQVRTRIEKGLEPARPIAGIANQASRERMASQGIDAGNIVAYKDRRGNTFVKPDL